MAKTDLKMTEKKDITVINLNDDHDCDDRSYKENDITPRISIDQDIPSVGLKTGKSEVDGAVKQSYASKKNVAEGMMDIALLTANANQLRFLIQFNSESKSFYVSVILIILSLILQVAVGIGLIFKRQMKNRGNSSKLKLANDFLVGGVFIITVINVFVASFTITETVKSN